MKFLTATLVLLTLTLQVSAQCCPAKCPLEEGSLWVFCKDGTMHAYCSDDGCQQYGMKKKDKDSGKKAKDNKTDKKAKEVNDKDQEANGDKNANDDKKGKHHHHKEKWCPEDGWWTEDGCIVRGSLWVACNGILYAYDPDDDCCAKNYGMKPKAKKSSDKDKSSDK